MIIATAAMDDRGEKHVVRVLLVGDQFERCANLDDLRES
jgi:hypothetical protein